MKSLLLAALVLTPAAQAEMIECPAQYPAKETTLAGSTGRVQPARLSFAYMHIGKLHSEQLLQGPEGKKVKGGWDTAYDFMPNDSKWLVCTYGGTEWSGLDSISPGPVQWWGKVKPQTASCLLKVRETKLRGSLSNWSATAVCKSSA